MAKERVCKATFQSIVMSVYCEVIFNMPRLHMFIIISLCRRSFILDTRDSRAQTAHAYPIARAPA